MEEETTAKILLAKTSYDLSDKAKISLALDVIKSQMTQRKKLDLAEKLLQGSLQEFDEKETTWLEGRETNQVQECRENLKSSKAYMENLLSAALQETGSMGSENMSIEV